MTKNTKSAKSSKPATKTSRAKKPAAKKAAPKAAKAPENVAPAASTAPVTASKPAARPPIPELKESSVKSPTKAVWAIADEMHKVDKNARRSDVIRACVDQGIALNTAKTQYQRWFSAQKA